MAFGKYEHICGNEIGEIRMDGTRSASEGEQIHATLHLKILNGRNNPL
jgi:hypothetical protein